MRLATARCVLAAGGAVLALASVSQARPGRDWSRVRNVETARQVRIVLHDDKAPRGRRKLSGVFSAATADSLTLVLQDGTTRTWQRNEVRRVSVKRAFLQRRKAWGVTALAACGAAVFHLLLHDPGSLGGWWASGRPQRAMGIIAVPVWIVATLELSHKPIYAAPRR